MNSAGVLFTFLAEIAQTDALIGPFMERRAFTDRQTEPDQ